jgi:hypothetical protein
MRIALVFPVLLFAASCGDAPVAVEEPAARAPGGAHAGHAHGTGFGGVAHLTGSLAEVAEGYLMVSVFPAGSRMPILSYKVGIDDPSVTTEGGKRVFTFTLDESTSQIPAQVPDGVPLEVEVRYDVDGYVDAGEGDVRARVAAKMGDEDLELTLEGP